MRSLTGTGCAWCTGRQGTVIFKRSRDPGEDPPVRPAVTYGTPGKPHVIDVTVDGQGGVLQVRFQSLSLPFTVSRAAGEPVNPADVAIEAVTYVALYPGEEGQAGGAGLPAAAVGADADAGEAGAGVLRAGQGAVRAGGGVRRPGGDRGAAERRGAPAGGVPGDAAAGRAGRVPVLCR